MFGDGKWRMIDSLGTSALIGGGEKEGGVGMRELCGSHCLKIPRFAPVRVEALPFHRLVHRLVSPPRSAFFGSFEVGNQLDCLSTPEKSPCALPSVHSFSCSRTLSLPPSPSPSLSHPHTRPRDNVVLPLFPPRRALLRADLARFRRGAASILLPSPFYLFLPLSSAPPYLAPCLLYPSSFLFLSSFSHA